MKSSVIASILAYTAIANASPVLVRSQTCNVAPAATPASAPAPLSSPSATTAIGCQQKCEADSSCQCFVFGLPPSAAAPKCILFAVPASQVPAQGTNLNVFDKACAASAVPTQAPTAAHPQGPANGSSSNGNVSAANGSGSGTGASKQDTQGKRVNGNGGAASGNGAAANSGKGSAANGNGAANSGKGAANSGNTTPNSGNGAATGSSNQNTQGNANVCGAAPSGPSQNPPSPFQTQANVASQQACLDLCQQTDGCKSCEFGSQSANGAKQCMLFKVPAAQLPPPSNGQSLVAFDTGC